MVSEEMLAAAREVASGVDDSAFERIYLAMKAAEPPVVADGGAIRVLCKAFNMHESFADTDDEPKLRDYLRNMAGLSDYQIDTTLLAMSSKADGVALLTEVRADIDFACTAIQRLHEHRGRARLERTLHRIDRHLASLTMESGDAS